MQNVPDEMKDWHPGSNNQVLDIVHPSLWPLIYDVTPILPPNRPIDSKISNPSKIFAYQGTPLASSAFSIGKGFAAQESTRYQWLPTDFHITPDREVSIQGYINNLDPTIHPNMYGIIGRIFERFVPLFERSVGRMIPTRAPWESPWVEDDERQSPLPAPDDDLDFWINKRRDFWLYKDVYDYVAKKRRKEKEERRRLQEGGEDGKEDAGVTEIGEDEDCEVETVTMDDRKGFEKANGLAPLTLPTARTGPPLYLYRSPLRLTSRTLRVITKIASIQLTPSSPSYPGGTWHIEGMQNEHIIATGIHYLSISNITPSFLSFRQALNADEGYFIGDQYEHDTIGPKFYGREGEGVANQVVGRVEAKQGRMVVFPNWYQHRVEPFELVDKTKLGWRTIMCFFLVHPCRVEEVVSTSRVPPQQREWLVAERERVVKDVLSAVVFGMGQKLPAEIVDLIWKETVWRWGDVRNGVGGS
ncbi:hypothetical protein HK097_007472 [Rhizophlyctis rosea]|uniref:DUF4246 domain-containing protein n=1 Tax=Rhizophlyctis rosea TaxID=64517 RepID=A0AAD5SD08_9FUNG|nr:hypothetical protein HK097_007472 [Rhizophlyctis rosea]